MASGDVVIDTIEQFIQNHMEGNPQSRGGPVLVAVSGGLDSMVLLHALRTVLRDLDVPLHALHVDHGIRPDSLEDSAFVEKMGHSWGVPVTVKTVTLSDIPNRFSRGLEADARTLRYQALREAAGEFGAGCVFLAHHADDQLETVLWRLIRGTTLTGVSGLRPLTLRDGIAWARPLLPCEKSDLTRYAKEHEVPHVEDSSNLDTTYTRNYLRHFVVPHLKQLQPSAAKHAVQFTETVAGEDSYMEEQALAWIRTYAVSCDASYKLPILPLLELARPLQRRIIKIILFYCLATVTWTRAHLEGILAIVEGSNPSAVMHLLQGLRVRREYETLVIGEQPDSTQGVERSWRLSDGATVLIPEVESHQSWIFVCHMWDPLTGMHLSSQNELLLPALEEVVIRPVKTSERLALLGTDGTKKVQDIFVDHKIPRQQRTAWPALYYQGQLLWIPGVVRSRYQLVHPLRHHTGWLITGQPAERM
jgi:tRNA(Ile)-lysidine synthase